MLINVTYPSHPRILAEECLQNNCVQVMKKRYDCNHPTYVAKMLLIGNPIPIRGCRTCDGEVGKSTISCFRAFSQLPSCSAIVARKPSWLWLALRSAPILESSSLVAFRTWENENRSDGVKIGVSAWLSPPPMAKWDIGSRRIDRNTCPDHLCESQHRFRLLRSSLESAGGKPFAYV